MDRRNIDEQDAMITRLLRENERQREALKGATVFTNQASAEIERLRLLAKRFANAIVTGQRHEGLICQAEDFLAVEHSKEGLDDQRG